MKKTPFSVERWYHWLLLSNLAELTSCLGNQINVFDHDVPFSTDKGFVD